FPYTPLFGSLRMVVVLHQADRQAPHIRVVFLVVGHPLLLQLRGPGCHRQRIATARGFTECRERDAVWCGRRGWWRTGATASTATAAGSHPDAGEVDLPVGSARG